MFRNQLTWLINHGTPGEVGERARSHPYEARRRERRSGRYPIHHLCRARKGSWSISEDDFELLLRLLLEAFPDAASRPDKKGMFPLHALLRYSPCLSLSSISLLMQEWSGAPCVQMKNGWFALHLLCQVV
jgi:hypothetical protein